MSTQECYQYTVGLCIHTLFTPYSPQCPYIHSPLSQKLFESSNCYIGFEKTILNEYTVLIKSCENKINYLTHLLKEQYVFDKNDIADQISAHIEKYPTCHELVKYYCEIKCESKLKRAICKNVHVCNVCAAVMDENDNECKHFLHNKYLMLRNVRDRLKKRVMKYQNETA